jgi:hypothetical protein
MKLTPNSNGEPEFREGNDCHNPSGPGGGEFCGTKGSGKAPPLKWTSSKVSKQSGDYVEAQTMVTRHVSADGRFTIEPTGSMSYKREFGVRGAMKSKFRWSGYRLTDHSPTLPKWLHPTEKHYSVASAKRAAARRAARKDDNT